jgi:hypothetical protein
MNLEIIVNKDIWSICAKGVGNLEDYTLCGIPLDDEDIIIVNETNEYPTCESCLEIIKYIKENF